MTIAVSIYNYVSLAHVMVSWLEYRQLTFGFSCFHSVCCLQNKVLID